MLKRFSIGGLRRQILMWSVVPMLAVLLVVGFFAFWTYGRVIEALVMDRNRELTRLLASQMGLELAEYADRLRALAEERSASDETRPFPWLSYLDGQKPYLHDFDSGVLVLNKEGIVTAADPRRLDLLGADLSNRSYFRRIQSQPEPLLLSDIEQDGIEGREVVAVVLPLLDEQGELSEILVGLFAIQPQTASAFYRSLLKLDLRMESQVYLVDSQGRAIYHHDPLRIGTSLSDQIAVRAVQEGRVGAWRGWVNGKEVVASYAPIPQTLCGLVEEESWLSLRRIAYGYGRVLVLILALGWFIPATIVSLAIRRITEPIHDLTESAHAMSLGQLRQIVNVPQGNELGELAQAFNHMSAQLQELYANMEARIEARTRELSAMNAIARVVSQSLDLNEILNAALEKTLEWMEMEAGIAYEIEPGNDLLTMVTQRGLTLNLWDQMPIDRVVPRETLRQGAQVWTAPSFPPSEGLWQEFLHEGWRQVVLVPLMAKGELLGLFALMTRRRRNVEAQELSFLTSIGNQIGIAVENARLYREAGTLAVMAERNRLAQDLHDSVTQMLFTVNLLAGVIPMLYKRDPQEAQCQLEELGRLTRHALNEMRALLLELRPATLAQTPLKELLTRLAEVTMGSSNLPVHVSVQPEIETIPSQVRIVLYRIAQEALNNVIRHSGADQAWITLKGLPGDHGGIEMIIRDDGQGFDPHHVEPGHLGLAIMRERASDIQADLHIESAPGGGTTIRVRWQKEHA